MKLSQLELNEFNELLKDISVIKQAYQKNSDSIHDFTCEQIQITSDEPLVLKQAQESLAVIVDKLDVVINSVELLHSHFNR